MGGGEGGGAQTKSQHTKLTLEKKILPLLLPEFELATFQSQVHCSCQQAILANRPRENKNRHETKYDTLT